MNKIKNIKEILPGLIVCVIIAYVGKFLGTFVPTIGGATLAIFLGMFVGNTFCNKKIYEKGSKFAEGNLLSYSVVLLGGTLSATTILKLGWSGVGFIAIQMIITIVAALLIGKKLGFSDNFRYLMATGNAVCGSSAIASVSPVIDANDDEKVISITMVNLIGTVLMILLPLIAKVLFNTELIKTSALLGGILQSVGQVVASGSMISEPVKDLSTIFKIVRIIFLVFVVIIMGNLKKRSSSNTNSTSSKSKIKIPWYVIGFFIMCALLTCNIISPALSKILKLISNNFEIIALAGIGMRVKFKKLISQGIKASLYGLLIGAVQIISAFTLISIFL